MTRLEHLLVCLMEECAEVTQAASKALRFGIDDGYPGTARKNGDDLVQELADLFAVGQMLSDGGFIDDKGSTKRIARKKAKVEEWLKYSDGRGTLSADV